MNWMESINEAINYIEEHLTEEITMEDIAKNSYVSAFYFQKGFAMLCGFTVGEYIRKRRLTLAGNDLINTNQKIIEIALKYGYEMNYKIVEKEAFTVMGVTGVFKYETGMLEVPKMWHDFFTSGKNENVCGMYGINMDLQMNGNEFEYMIADDYRPAMEVPEGFVTKIIPKHTWAVFACKGPSDQTIQEINKNIFSEWLPNCKEYEIAEGYNIEMYTDASLYPNGVQDENYYGEIWIPVKKK